MKEQLYPLSCMNIIQRVQSEIVDAHWYVSNAAIQRDLGIKFIHELIQEISN